MAHNQLTDLPRSIANMGRLVDLDISANAFEEWPPILGQVRACVCVCVRVRACLCVRACVCVDEWVCGVCGFLWMGVHLCARTCVSVCVKCVLVDRL